MSNYPGFGLTQRSRDAWAEIEEKKRREQEIQHQRRAQIERERTVQHTRELIEWARAEYSNAKFRHAKNIKVFAELTLNWSPERVLSRHANFNEMKRLLSDEVTWKMLTRSERRFIAKAVEQ